MKDPDLSTLLINRICHDLSSSVGAAINGLELIDDAINEDEKDDYFDLINKAIRQAGEQVKYYKIAFGLSVKNLEFDNLKKHIYSFFKNSRFDVELPEEELGNSDNLIVYSLLLNMLLIAKENIPLGGKLKVNKTECFFEIEVIGNKIIFDKENFDKLLSLESNNDINQNTVIISLAMNLANNLGLNISAKKLNQKLLFSLVYKK